MWNIVKQYAILHLMVPRTFIFIGRSGCGKGTQAKLLQDYIENQDEHKHPFFYVETGARFRDFIKGDKLANKLSAKIYENGDRQPDFLAAWMWSNFLLEHMTGNEHLFLDGTPRSLPEAKILDTAIKFFERQKPFVIHIDISRECSTKRLIARGRSDDKSQEEIKKRLDWYDRDVVPAFGFFDESPDYNLLNINGDQPIEKVFQDIVDEIKKHQ